MTAKMWTPFFCHIEKRMYLCSVKHLFILNPDAGKKDHTAEIERQITTYSQHIDYEIYRIDGRPGTMRRYVNDYCIDHPNQPTRFYACGGDGTLKEVASGIVGHPQAQLACYPCGSGNDYVKYYGGQERFLNLPNLIQGTPSPVDIFHIEAQTAQGVEDHYAINIVNFGFDAAVCNTMINVRRKPIIGGRNAYTTGVVYALMHARKNECRIEVDGQLINDAPFLLCTIANGQYVGGSYRCAPRSVNNDGVADLCMVRPVSLLRFVTLIRAYALGRHLDDPRFAPHIHYCRGKKFVLSNPEPFWVTLDGDMILTTHCSIEEMPQAVQFIIPKQG